MVDVVVAVGEGIGVNVEVEVGWRGVADEEPGDAGIQAVTRIRVASIAKVE